MDEKTTNHITYERFKEGLLRALGHHPKELTPEEQEAIIRHVEENWWFCGGQDTRSGMNSSYDRDQMGETGSVSPEVLLRWKALWHHYFPHHEMPEPTEECVCGHSHLRYNCYITDGNIRTVITTGRICIQQFLPKLAKRMNGKRCDDCKQPHRNRNDNYCNDCRLRRKEERWRAEEQRAQEERQRERERERKRQEEERKRQEEEKERLARTCDCGRKKEPTYPRCWTCHAKRVSSMTSTDKKKLLCACGKGKQPQYDRCFQCGLASRTRLAQFLVGK